MKLRNLFPLFLLVPLASCSGKPEVAEIEVEPYVPVYCIRSITSDGKTFWLDMPSKWRPNEPPLSVDAKTIKYVQDRGITDCPADDFRMTLE